MVHADAKRHKDKECVGKWHEEFLSAMMGVWDATTIFNPELGDVDVPVGGFIIFSGSKALNIPVYIGICF